MNEKFGSYILLDKIAEGGMAELYLAKSSKVVGLEKYLVIKRILPKFSNSKDLIDLFINEAKININMSHNNIVSIFDFGVEAGRFYIAMEYIQGANLKSIIKDFSYSEINPLSLPESIYIIAQAAKGLSYAHRCKDMTTREPLNIIHRDISPDNIMIDLEGNVKVIDFGVAVDSENNNRSTQEGKLSYMAPEQINGGKITTQTDVFALGIVLWELLAQKRLYKAQDKTQTIDNVKNCKIKDISSVNTEVSEDLAGLVHKALKKEPQERFESMEDFSRELTKYLNTNHPDFTTAALTKKLDSCYEKDFTEIQATMTKSVAISSLEDYLENDNDDKTFVTVADPLQVRTPKKRTITAKRLIKKRKRVKKAS